MNATHRRRVEWEMNARILAILVVLLLALNVCHAGDPEKYTHVVSWSEAWDGVHSKDLDKIELKLDDRPIGAVDRALAILQDLPVKGGDRIKLDGMKSLEQEKPIFIVCKFLYDWVDAGVLVDIFENGKKLNAHFVRVHVDQLIDNKRPFKTLDDVVWMVDGVKMLGSAEFEAEIKKLAKKKGALIVKLEPTLEGRNNIEAYGENNKLLDVLADRREVRIWPIVLHDFKK